MKSAHSANLLSLTRYKEKFGDRVADGIVLHHGDVTRKRHTNYLPYYMATVLCVAMVSAINFALPKTKNRPRFSPTNSPKRHEIRDVLSVVNDGDSLLCQ